MPEFIEDDERGRLRPYTSPGIPSKDDKLKINDGGSAYPVPYQTNGMSLRDYFAAQALMGLCANAIPGSHHQAKNRAREAYEAADAMIAERSKEQPK